MTAKERADARTELLDMAYEMERKAMQMDGDDFTRGRRMDRVRMLQRVADELRYPRAATEAA